MALRRRAVPYALGLPLGACLYGAASDLFDWPDPLPLFVDTARASTPVTEALGSPIIRSPLWSGSAGRERVAASVPLFGPRGRGTLHARAFRAPDTPASEALAGAGAARGAAAALVPGLYGEWQPVVLLLELPGGSVVDLLDGGKAVEAGEGPLWATDAPRHEHAFPRHPGPER